MTNLLHLVLWTSLLAPPLAVAANCVGAAAAQTCPPECSCDDQCLHIACVGKNLSSVPTNLPSTTKVLDLSSNAIHTINKTTFVNLTGLVSLDLTNNNISHIDSHALLHLKLTTLRLSNNSLITMSFFLPTNLSIFDISQNTLHAILFYVNQTTFQNESLHFNFSSNGIEHLQNSTFEPFSNFTHLNLDLSRNPLHSLQPGAFDFVQKPRNDSDPRQFHLHFRHVRLGKLVKNLATSLTGPLAISLDVSHTNATSEDILNLTQNINISALSASHNPVKQIPWKTLPKTLVDLHFKNVNLSSMSNLTFSMLLNLTTLDLSSNPRLYVPVSAVNTSFALVNHLRLDECAFTSAFLKLSELSHVLSLDLAGNQLTGWLTNTTQKYPVLKSLSLARNKISHPDAEWFAAVADGFTVDLSENPFNCSCTPLMSHFVALVRDDTAMFVNANGMKCSGGQHSGVVLSHLTETILCPVPVTTTLVPVTEGTKVVVIILASLALSVVVGTLFATGYFAVKRFRRTGAVPYTVHVDSEPTPDAELIQD